MTNVFNKKVRARGKFYKGYFLVVVLYDFYIREDSAYTGWSVCWRNLICCFHNYVDKLNIPVCMEEFDNMSAMRT